MKLLLVLGMTLSLIACGGLGNSVPTQTINDSVSDLEGLPVAAQGTLVGENDYETSGNIEIIFNSVTNTYSLLMNNFSTENGPSLKVYLSQGPQPFAFINLGDLSSTNGNLRYDFPAPSSITSFTHVLIWCDAFNIGFGNAPLFTP